MVVKDARGAAPARDVERRNRRQQIDPAPGDEISPAALGAVETDEEVAHEHHADREVHVFDNRLRLGGRARCRERQQVKRIQAQREHEKLIAGRSFGRAMHGVLREASGGSRQALR
jgi:hypothetical protein